MSLKKAISTFLFCMAFAKGSELEVEDSKSLCPKYWTDATHVNMGCILFNATTSMTWSSAQEFCWSVNSHLVEIFSQEEQDFLAMKAFESELLTGAKRNWWIGLTDDHSEGRWYWIHSLKVADYFSWGTRNPDGKPDGSDGVNFVSMYGDFDYTWTDEFQSGAYNAGGSPICQFSI